VFVQAFHHLFIQAGQVAHLGLQQIAHVFQPCGVHGVQAHPGVVGQFWMTDAQGMRNVGTQLPQDKKLGDRL
jgi:hypothetical protein